MAIKVKVLLISCAIALALYLALFFTEVGFFSNTSSSARNSKDLLKCEDLKCEDLKCEDLKCEDFCEDSLGGKLLDPEPPVQPPPSWLINDPDYFYQRSFDGSMVDVRNNAAEMALFENFTDNSKFNEDTDYEAVDALEQFFWGQKNGLAIELGATGGGEDTNSQTYDYEKRFGWRRILVEGNPKQRSALLQTSPNSFVASAAVCKDTTTLHFMDKGYVSGIAEFMSDDFIRKFHKSVYQTMVPPGNFSSVDWSKVPATDYVIVECVPMAAILRQARATHVNYFMLDVEGAEYQVLEAIDWRRIKFDVVCIEIDPGNRPAGNTDRVVRFMASKGYLNYSGLIGRNIWFVRNDFIPQKRPSNLQLGGKYEQKDICFRRSCPRPRFGANYNQ